MHLSFRRLTSPELVIGLFVSSILVACGSEPASVAETSNADKDRPALTGSATGGAANGDEEQTNDVIDTLPLPKRLAFMTGHVEAGLALYRAGEPQMAAPHLLHPVSETHAAERKGLDAMGFNASVFEAVSSALEEGLPASDIEPQLKAAESNLAMLAKTAGGDPAEVIRYLMEMVVDEYSVAITDGQVSDPGEFQDAYGFAVVARDRAQELPAQIRPAVTGELNDLIALWPAAPIPPKDPIPVEQITQQTSRVLGALQSG